MAEHVEGLRISRTNGVLKGGSHVGNLGVRTIRLGVGWENTNAHGDSTEEFHDGDVFFVGVTPEAVAVLFAVGEHGPEWLVE